MIRLDEYDPGHYVRQSGYEAFIPTPINRAWTWDDARINTLLEEATRALVELDAFSRIVPDVDLFIRLHVVKEASASSRIEGTETEIDEVIRPEEEVVPERRDDWEEVQNYIQAMNEAIATLDVLPLSTRLLRQTHRTLMQGVRGQHKQPGEYRKSQNWIGGATLEDAAFIPPPHHEVSRLMSDLEKFWHNEEINVPHLVRIAISHYQFETIHPFLDGNGRIGRLLITLYLMNQGFLRKPSLYLSSYIDQHRPAYFDALRRVSGSGDMGHWIRFFLVAVRDTARTGSETFEAILALRERIEKEVLELGQKAANARRLLTLLYRQPLVRTSDVVDHLEVSHPTAISLLRDFERLGLLDETTGNQRYLRYRFSEYLDLFAR
ncbi:MAG: Fic family protein [Rhodothermales bacterium]